MRQIHAAQVRIHNQGAYLAIAFVAKGGFELQRASALFDGQLVQPDLVVVEQKIRLGMGAGEFPEPHIGCIDVHMDRTLLEEVVDTAKRLAKGAFGISARRRPGRPIDQGKKVLQVERGCREIPVHRDVLCVAVEQGNEIPGDTRHHYPAIAGVNSQRLDHEILVFEEDPPFAAAKPEMVGEIHQTGGVEVQMAVDRRSGRVVLGEGAGIDEVHVAGAIGELERLAAGEIVETREVELCVQVTLHLRMFQIRDKDGVTAEWNIFKSAGKGQDTNGRVFIAAFQSLFPFVVKGGFKRCVGKTPRRRQHAAMAQVQLDMDLWRGIVGGAGVDGSVDVHGFVDIVYVDLLLDIGCEERRRIMEAEVFRLDVQEERVGNHGREEAPAKGEGMAVDLDGGFCKLDDLAGCIVFDRKMARKELVLYKAAFFGVERQAVDIDAGPDVKPELAVLFLDAAGKMTDVDMEKLGFVLPLHDEVHVDQLDIR